MTRDLHVLMVFLDGVGLGSRTSRDNPFVVGHYPSLEKLIDGQKWSMETVPVESEGHVFRAIDAKLGMPGLPQSGTGQATLLTGVNCARIAGRHYGPYPHSATLPTVREHNVFRQVQELDGGSPHGAAFANAYPRRFFDLASVRDRWTVTTRCCLDAGLEIRSTERLIRGEAVSADLTGASWPEADVRIAPISEQEAAARLHAIARDHSFTLFEYYLTDKAGHARDPVLADHVLRSLDAFFEGLLQIVDMNRDLLVVTSDHGNLEDLSTKTHTMHDVPLVALGAGAGHFREVEDIAGVLPGLLDAFHSSAAS